MTKKFEDHHIHDRQSIMTRRELLIALGILGTGAGVCSGSSALAWLIWRQLSPSQTDVTAEVTPIPSEIPISPPPEIIGRDVWGALSPDHDAPNERGYYSVLNPGGWRIYEGELADAYQTLVLHHSVIYEGDDLKTVQAIQRLHREDRGWADLAYHFLIGRGGTIFAGRDWHVRGTHVAGYNSGSLGICLLGNFMVDYPTHDQLTATRRLIVYLAERLRLTHIVDHRAFNPQTQCPGDHLHPYVEQFAAAANLAIGTEGYIAPNAG